MIEKLCENLSQLQEKYKKLEAEVERGEKSIKLDVNIIVEYGTRIPDIAFEIQNRVKKEVEEKTGLKVEDVNVNVQGIKTFFNDQSEETEGQEDNQ